MHPGLHILISVAVFGATVEGVSSSPVILGAEGAGGALAALAGAAAEVEEPGNLGLRRRRAVLVALAGAAAEVEADRRSWLA